MRGASRGLRRRRIAGGALTLALLLVLLALRGGGRPGTSDGVPPQPAPPRVAAAPARPATGESAALPLDERRIAAREMSDRARQLGRQQTAAALTQALDLTRQASALWRQAGDKAGEAAARNQMGRLYVDLGERQKAIEAYRSALPLWQALGDAKNEGYARDGLGLLYWSLGESETALRYLAAALQLHRRAGNGMGESITLFKMGMVHEAQHEPRQALARYREVLELCLAAGCDAVDQAPAHGGIGRAHLALGDTAQAATHVEQAVSFSRRGSDRRWHASLLLDLGAVRDARGELAVARPVYRQALELFRTLGHPEEAAYALFGLARSELGTGQLAAADQHAREALALIEAERIKVAGAELRSSFLARRGAFYELRIAVLMARHRQAPRAGFAALAFAVSERSRARGLLETLAEAGTDVRRGVEPRLLAREQELRKRVGESSLAGLQKGDGRRGTTGTTELERTLDDYRAVAAEIRSHSPRYAALTPEPLGLESIQQLLDPETLLLSFALGAERSYLWVVSPTTIDSFDLPPAATIEAAARRAYGLLVESHHRAAWAPAQRALAELSAMILDPVAPRLLGKRLLIASEGSLQYVPFPALPVPGSPRTPLIAEHEVVNLPSASSLAILRRGAAARRPARKLLAVVSDPVFRANDPRLGAWAAPLDRLAPAAGADLLRSLGEAGIQRLDRLPFSRREAEAILALVPPGEALRAVDFAASRATVTGGGLGGYRLVHFATHGLLNSTHPELSGIVLSLVDERGRAQDGFLRLDDLYDLELGADLVVLSACQTALGKEVRGEGLVGLARGFHYAGAPRVVASLWNVRDEATAELMQRFYRGMLRDDLRPAAALRQAQVSMWQEQRWAAPYYWAGFVLQGEWR